MAQAALACSHLSTPVLSLHRTSDRTTAFQTRKIVMPARAIIGDFGTALAPPHSVVPRITRLRDFHDSSIGGACDSPASLAVTVVADGKGKPLADLLMAAVEANAQVVDFETVAGRAAMVLLTIALSVEFLTGNGIFSSVDPQSLLPVASLGLIAAVSAGVYAFAWRAKGHVADILSHGCMHWMDDTVDQIIDGVFFKGPRKAPQYLPVESSSPCRIE